MLSEISRPKRKLKTCRRGCLSLIHLLMGLKSGGYISTHSTHYNFPPFWDEHAIKDAPALWAGHSYTHIQRTIWGHLNENGGFTRNNQSRPLEEFAS